MWRPGDGLHMHTFGMNWITDWRCSHAQNSLAVCDVQLSALWYLHSGVFLICLCFVRLSCSTSIFRNPLLPSSTNWWKAWSQKSGGCRSRLMSMCLRWNITCGFVVQVSARFCPHRVLHHSLNQQPLDGSRHQRTIKVNKAMWLSWLPVLRGSSHFIMKTQLHSKHWCEWAAEEEIHTPLHFAHSTNEHLVFQRSVFLLWWRCTSGKFWWRISMQHRESC